MSPERDAPALATGHSNGIRQLLEPVTGPLLQGPLPSAESRAGAARKGWQGAFYLLSFLLNHSLCISASSSLPVISGSTHKGWSCLTRGQASVNSIRVPVRVKQLEEVISVSQRLLVWCSHHKKGFSAGTGWKMTLCYLNDYFGVFSWGAVTVLEQQQPSQASW